MACSQTTSSQRTPSHVLVVGVESSSSFSKISRLIHRGLFRVNERFEIVPDLIESFEQPDMRHYVFHLKNGVFFHDGQSLIADDVVSTLQRARLSESRFPYKDVLDKIEEIQASDPTTIRVTLKEPYVPFLSALTLGITPHDRSESIGTGPFSLEFIAPDRVKLKKINSLNDSSQVSFVEFVVIPDEGLRVLALKNGSVDVLQNDIPPSLISSLRQDPHIKIQSTEGFQTTYLKLNLNEPHLAQLEIRKDLAYALDLPSMLEEHLEGLGSVAKTLLPVSHWAYQNDVSSYPSNFQTRLAAKVSLNRLNYFDPDGDGPQTRFSLTLKTSTEKKDLSLARLIAKQLKTIGIGVKIVSQEKAIFFSDVAQGRYDLVLMKTPEEAAVLAEPIFFKNMYHQETVDQLTDSINKTLSRSSSERREIYGWIQKLFSQDLPVIPLWNEKNMIVYSDRLQNVRLRPDESFEWLLDVTKDQPKSERSLP